MERTIWCSNRFIIFSLAYVWVSLVRQWIMKKLEIYVSKILLRNDFKVVFMSFSQNLPNPYSCLIANNFILITFHLKLMKRESSQLVGKHRKQNEYIGSTSGSNLAEFNACEESTQKRWSSLQMFIIIHWLKTNGWYRNHSYNTLMKKSILTR